jgi:hypothetical protein
MEFNSGFKVLKQTELIHKKKTVRRRGTLKSVVLVRRLLECVAKAETNPALSAFLKFLPSFKLSVVDSETASFPTVTCVKLIGIWRDSKPNFLVSADMWSRDIRPDLGLQAFMVKISRNFFV